MKTLIVVTLMILAASYCLWVAVPAVYPGSLQITNGKRMISDHVAAGASVAGTPYPPGFGLPVFKECTPRTKP